jgi:hypothetical protein
VNAQPPLRLQRAALALQRDRAGRLDLEQWPEDAEQREHERREAQVGQRRGAEEHADERTARERPQRLQVAAEQLSDGEQRQG